MFLYIFEKSAFSDVNDQTLITREAHIVDDLKAKMLVNMNVIKSKHVDILISRKIAIINSCNIVVFIKMRS